MEDDRGIFAVMIALVHGALAPAPEPRRAAAQPKLRWLERVERWAARGRERNRERYLAQSQDIFDLERRLRQLERAPYYL